MGLRIAMHLEREVLFDQLLQRRRRLLLVGLGLGTNRERDNPCGRVSGGIMSTGAFSSHSVSPVVVSLSLATATISPASALASGDCFLPSRRSSWPKRSFDSRVELSTAASVCARPDITRKIESLPAKGSITVLNTNAENGAAGSAGADGSPFVGFWPCTGGRSLGAGRNVVIASSSGRDADILRARAA